MTNSATAVSPGPLQLPAWRIAAWQRWFLHSIEQAQEQREVAAQEARQAGE